MRVVSLFAGVGGIDLGLEAAGRSLGIPVEIVAQAEINRHSQAVLRRHWPGIRLWFDITELPARHVPDVAENFAIDSDMFRWAARTGQRKVIYFSSSAAYPVQYQDGESDLPLEEGIRRCFR